MGLNAPQPSADSGECSENVGASIIVNKGGSGWRDAVAQALRRWAQRLDGRLSLTVEFRTTHPVDQTRLQYCMDRGLECAVQHATEFARESARYGKRYGKPG